MGQAVAAVALGIIKTKAMDKEIRIKLQESEWGTWLPGLGKNEPNADSGMTDRFNILGFVVALAGEDSKCPGARNDVPDLPIGNLDEAERIIGPNHIAAGRAKWVAFARFARKHGVILPDPTLIVTEVEIA